MKMDRRCENILLNFAGIFLISLTVGVLVALPPAKARFEYVKDLPQSLKSYCNVCHTASSGKGPLNVFGEDYLRLGLDMNATANLDSDGDGFTNEEELAASTFPGDPNSYPGSSSQGIPMLESIVLVVVLLFIVLLVFGVFRRKGKGKHAVSSGTNQSG